MNSMCRQQLMWFGKKALSCLVCLMWWHIAYYCCFVFRNSNSLLLCSIYSMLCLYSVIYCTMLLCCFVVSDILHFVSFMFGMQILTNLVLYNSWFAGIFIYPVYCCILLRWYSLLNCFYCLIFWIITFYCVLF